MPLTPSIIGIGRRGFAAAALSLFSLVACSSNPKIGEAKRAHLYPALCAKQQECLAPEVFAASYPGGTDDCRSKADTVGSTSNDDQESACDDDEWKQCASDIGAATCPADTGAGGLPPMPSSCTKC